MTPIETQRARVRKSLHALRTRLKSQGICVDCCKRPTTGKTTCAMCAKKRSVRAKASAQRKNAVQCLPCELGRHMVCDGEGCVCACAAELDKIRRAA